ncbi:MAG: PKD domain-containing protein [Bacteroidia bacterium]
MNGLIRPLIPFVTDVEPFRHGSDIAMSHSEARLMLEHLAWDWNYYQYCGSTHGNYSYLHRPPNLVDSIYFPFHILRSLNNPANDGLPRSLITYWNQVSESFLHDGDTLSGYYRSPIILQQSPLPVWYSPPALSDTFFIRDSTWAAWFPPLGPLWRDAFNRTRLNWAMAASPLDTRFQLLGLDGAVQAQLVDTFLDYLSNPYIDLVAENDEVVGIFDNNFVFRDAEITRDWHANFPGWDRRAYQGFRGNQFRESYQSQWLARINNYNATAGRAAPETWWYEVQGEPFSYTQERQIVVNRDTRHRAGSTFYPNNPRWWRHGRGALTGMDQLCISLRHQLQAGDSLWIPAVSPGFNDGKTWQIEDVEQIRPGQYLGQLKAMAAMGAESYNTFMLQTSLPPDTFGIAANWRTWHLPMASYAQAITSRFRDFMYAGEVLNGDTTWTYNGGTLPTYYTFSTGNNNDLITARKLHGAYTYIIGASAQRTGNMPSQAPKEKVVSFKFRDNQNVQLGFQRIAVKERLQGSTYVLDMNGPNAPVFYQLDRWHEWKEPGRWCRDFDFEAEVWDSAAGTASVRTERPVPATSGDFTEFTSYVRHTGPGGWTRYYFRPTGDDQHTLHLPWLRNNAGVGRQVQVSGAGTGHIWVLPDTAFGWHGRDAGGAYMLLAPLDTTEHFVEIRPQGTQVDIDRVVLLRAGMWTPPWGVNANIIQWDDSICLGALATFVGKLGGGPGCHDHEWDFGDGTHSSAGTYADTVASSLHDTITHLYQYPGDYQVTLTITSALFGTTMSHSVWVHVGAPVVDAGADTVACRGVGITLQGSVGAGTTGFHWSDPAPASLSDTLVLNPVATLDSSQYFYLTADSGGCSMTDSVWVTAVGLDSVHWPDTVWVCAGMPDTLSVSGAFWVTWDPRPGLSGYNIPNPLATPSVTTTYPFTATDVGRCDTVRDSVVVVVRGITQQDTT